MVPIRSYLFCSRDDVIATNNLANHVPDVMGIFLGVKKVDVIYSTFERVKNGEKEITPRKVVVGAEF